MPLTDDPSELEPELERLFLRYVPDMASRWTRASDEHIAAIEAFAGRPLPRCYQWMLMRLGQGWSNIAYATLDMAARTVVQANTQHIVPAVEGMLCIALDHDEYQPQARYYDLAHATEHDAPVFIAGLEEGELRTSYETLREFLGLAVFDNYRLREHPTRVEGIVYADQGTNALDELEAFLEQLGFRSPIPTGAYCTVYDDGTASLSSYVVPDPKRSLHSLPIDLAGPDEATLRKILGLISASGSLNVRRLTWQPLI